MSRSLVQPIGQKRLTNVAVVRLKKHGMRFEIACYKNKVLSWRARVEKDIDEVLQSHTVYANVSKGIVAKSKDLLQAFGTDNEDKICLEILEKGELQVAGKERESILSSQFRDIATIVMEKTINPDTQRPYTISMIERFMHDSHFAIDPHRSSKKQALELIKMLEKRFSIARARMKLWLIVPSHEGPSLMNKLASWNTYVEESFDDNNSFLVVCQVEPGDFRACDTLVRESHGRLEVVSMAVQKEGDGTVDESDGEADEEPSSSFPSKVSPSQHDEDLVQGMDSVTLSSIPSSPVLRQKEDNTHPEPPSAEVLKVHRCKTCNADVGDAKQYREHFKSEWHKHNLKRKLKQLQPLSAEECLLDTDITDTINDSNEYCH